MSDHYQIAGHLSPKDLTRVDTASQFAKCVRDLFERIRPGRIIETGTYFGNGTTMVIASAVRDLGIDARFISIEINPKNIARAKANLEKTGLSVELLNGLSVPRADLPSFEQIEHELVQTVMADGLIVDHEEQERARLYHQETNFQGLPDDMLGHALREFDHRPDFVLLDSGGHMGFVEFRYLIDQLRGPCYIALDDIYHVKHYRSFRQVCTDPRFRLVVASEEKFGFCVAHFEPHFGPKSGD